MSGSDDDFRLWLKQHGPALLLLARQYVRSLNEAEDIVQDSLVRFWRSRDKVLDRQAFMYICVKRCALDWQRSEKRRVRRDETTARPAAGTLFVATPEQAERVAAIETALQSLPAEQAEVVVMKIWGGLTFQQIATALGVSPNTAASRYRYALAAMREALAEEYSNDST